MRHVDGPQRQGHWPRVNRQEKEQVECKDDLPVSRDLIDLGLFVTK